MGTRPLVTLCLVFLTVWCCSVVSAASSKERLLNKFKSSRSSSLVATSDPANSPISIESFLKGDDLSAHGLDDAWRNALGAPSDSWQVGPSDLIVNNQQPDSRFNLQAARAHSDNTALIEQGAAAQWVREGLVPAQAPWPAPHKLLKQPKPLGVSHPHNHIKHALGVTSTAIPWLFRSYAQQHNPHRKIEPLLYTPLVIAESPDGKSAVDLTHLVNHRLSYQRSVNDPAYEPTTGTLTNYVRRPYAPLNWLPTMPKEAAKKAASRPWEKHFLDIYAPTPPPLMAPVPPRSPAAKAASKKAISFLEHQTAHLVDLPQHEHVKSMYSTLTSQSHPVEYVDQHAIDEATKSQFDINPWAPANDDRSQQLMPEPAMLLELDEEIENMDEQDEE